MNVVRYNINNRDYYLWCVMLDNDAYSILKKLESKYVEEYGPTDINKLFNAFVKYVMEGRNYYDAVKIIHSITQRTGDVR